jgi:methylmalonyl-CoA/ethylmalonyl-CoA epimerase
MPMIGRLNHVAIAVPDLEAAAAQYRHALGAKVRLSRSRRMA